MVRLSQVQRNLLILISRDCKLWISLISSKSLKSISETNGCAKMDIKGRERKRNEKGSVDLKIWTKVHGLRTGGTGFPKPAAPVFQNRRHRFLSAAQDIPATYPVTVTSSPHLPPSLTHDSE
jgi:hypothetical protein